MLADWCSAYALATPIVGVFSPATNFGVHGQKRAMSDSSLSAKYDRFSRIDESAQLHESEPVRASEAAVKAREREEWRAKQAQASDVRARWARGELGDADYARLARESGVSAKEVLAELKERQAQRRPTIDNAAVDRGDVAALSLAAGVDAAGAAGAAVDAAAAAEVERALGAAEERKAVATALLQRAHHTEALEGLRAALAALAALPPHVAAAPRARALRLACLGNCALAHLALKQWAEAEGACGLVLAAEPRNVKGLMRRASARTALGRRADAAADLDAAALLEPSNHAIQNAIAELGRAALGLGGPTAAAAAAPAPTVSTLSRTYCYLDVSVDGAPPGRIVLQLFDDLCPLTCANFAALCAGWAGGATAGAATAAPGADTGDGAKGAAAAEGAAAAAAAAAARPTLCYAGSRVHRVVKGFAIQGGDILRGDGSGSVSIYGASFPDESFAVPHARPGVLSMANNGPDSNGCQFFLTTDAAPHLDRKHVGFGRVLRGMAVVHQLEAVPTIGESEAPAVDVLIVGCGVLPAAEVSLAAADDDGITSYGADALVLAAARGDARMAAVLAQAGAELNARVAVPIAFAGGETVEGLPALAAAAARLGLSAERTALHAAAANGHEAVVVGLIEARADVGAVDSTGATALHLAVRDARSACCVRALLAGGADATALTASGATAAHLAAESGDEPCLRALLERPALTEPAAAGAALPPAAAEAVANVTGVGGVTPLHVAAAGDRAGCVRLLLAHGARPLHLAAGELSAVHVAAAKGALRALGALLEAAGPAAASAPGGASGKAPLHAAAEHGAAEAARALLAAGAAADAADTRGSTPLHWAALGGHLACARALLDGGADAAVATTRGATALHVACEHGHAEVARALLEAGAPPSASAQGDVTPLHAAAKSGSVLCARLLLAAGADADAQMTVRVDSAGHKTVTRKRAIHVAAEDGHAAVVAELLAAGADAHALAAIEAPESTALTSALFNAQRNQHADVVALLEAAGCEAVSTVGVAV